MNNFLIHEVNSLIWMVHGGLMPRPPAGRLAVPAAARYWERRQDPEATTKVDHPA
jgi:hypothetical protein